MSPYPSLSIVIISYNTKELTKACIESIYDQTKQTNFEIIVVDNHSTDGSREMLSELAKLHANIQLILREDNLGYGKGNNLAAKQAKSDYILFLNSDTEVLENGVDRLLEYYTYHEQTVHFLGGKLFNRDMSPQASCGPFYTLPVVFAALFLRGDYYGLTRYSPSLPRKVDWVSGACILTKKDYFEKIGGFDEQIFMYMEEVDLLFRAKKAGYNTWFSPSGHFIHYGSASSNGKTYPIIQVYKGFLYFYKKHYSPFLTVFLRILLQLKALMAICIGFAIQSSYLKKTYGQAYQIASMD